MINQKLLYFYYMGQDEKILAAKQIIDTSSKITVLTGAGISAESGIPTFRDNDGMWNNIRPQDIASPHAFKKDPELVWEWYDWRRRIINKANPNQGHYALAEIERQKEKFTLITQNIDGLHEIAGSINLMELHGNIWEIRCEKCDTVNKNYEVPLPEIPPKCNKCGEITRPNVVWFEEIIPMHMIDQALLSIEESDLMLIIGTSGIVEPAASMGLLAKQSGKQVIEIHLEETPNSAIYNISLQGKSGEILPLFYDIAETYN